MEASKSRHQISMIFSHCKFDQSRSHVRCVRVCWFQPMRMRGRLELTNQRPALANSNISTESMFKYSVLAIAGYTIINHELFPPWRLETSESLMKTNCWYAVYSWLQLRWQLNEINSNIKISYFLVCLKSSLWMRSLYWSSDNVGAAKSDVKMGRREALWGETEIWVK